MSETQLFVLYILVWIGILANLGGIVIWWGVFKIPNSYIGMRKDGKVYSTGWHFNLLSRFTNIVLVNLSELEAKLADKVREKTRQLEASINSISSQMKFSFPIDYQADIHEFVSDRKIELLFGTAEIDGLVTKITERLQTDLPQLQKANALYRQAMRLYRDTSKQVNRIGSVPLIIDMEEHYRGLASDNLMALLTERKWNEFRDVMNSAIEEFQRLKDLAAKYEAHQEAYQEFEEEPFDLESDEEKAYRILGVPPTVTNEQIKKLYKKLALVYHPDTNAIGDDKRFKEIDWAYKVLKAARHIP